MTSPEISLVFPATYNVSVCAELPASASRRRYEIHRPSDTPGAHLLLEVTTDDGDWWLAAVRQPVKPVTRAMTGVFSTPSQLTMCVVAHGDAFLVDVDRPGNFKWLEGVSPVVGFRPLVEEGLLLLTTPWTVTAIDRAGTRWTTERLAMDGLRLDETDGGFVAGVADPRDDEPRDFVIDLRSGFHEGGIATAGP